MNEKEMEENLKKTFKIHEISAEILTNVYELAAKLVDEKMPYAELIEKSTLHSERIELCDMRERAISAISVNILAIGDDVRL